MSARGICKRCNQDRDIYSRVHCKPCREVMMREGTWDAVPLMRTLKDLSKLGTCEHCGKESYMYRARTCWQCWKVLKGVGRVKPKGNPSYQRLAGADHVTVWPSPRAFECEMGLLWRCFAVGEFEDEECVLADVGGERLWMPRKGLTEVKEEVWI